MSSKERNRFTNLIYDKMKTLNILQNLTLSMITLFVYSMAVRILIDIWVNHVSRLSFVELSYASATSVFVLVIGWFLLLINIAVWKDKS